MNTFSPDERTKLKAYYDSMLGLREIYENIGGISVGTTTFKGLEREVLEIMAVFPDLLPPFAATPFEWNGPRGFYDLTALKIVHRDLSQ